MIIEEVELENFVSHRKSRITLGPGVIVIVGPNGAGKTSIIDAITYSLFSTHSRGQRRAREPIIRLGATYASVKLVFSIGGRRYLLHRIVQRRGESSARLYVVANGGNLKLVANSVKAVEAEIEKLLGVPLQVANALLVARQGEIEAILLNPRERKRFIDAILHIEAISKAYDRMSGVIKFWATREAAITEKLREYRRKLVELRRKEEELDRIRKQIVDLEDRIEPLRSDVESIRGELDRLRRVIDELHDAERRLERLRGEKEQSMKRLRAVNEQLAKYTEEMSLLETEYQGIWDRLEELRRLMDLLRQREELKERLEELEERLRYFKGIEEKYNVYEELVKEKHSLEETLKTLEDQYNRYLAVRSELERVDKDIERYRREEERVLDELRRLLGKTLAEIDADTARRIVDSSLYQVDNMISDIEDRLRRLSEDRGRVNSLLREMQNRLEMLSRAGSNCPLCEQPLTTGLRENIIRRLRSEKERLRSKLYEIDREISELRQQKEKLTSKKKELERLRSLVYELTNRLAIIARERALQEDRKKMLEREALELWRFAQEYSELRKRLEEVREKLKEMEPIVEEYDEYRILSKEYNELKQRLSAIDELVEDTIGEIGVAFDSSSEVEAIVRRAEEALARYKVLKKTVSELLGEQRELNERLSVIDEEMRELEKVVRERRSAREEYERLERILREKESKLREVEAELWRLKGIAEQLEEDVSVKPELEREVAELEKKAKAVSEMVAILERLRSLFGPQGLPQVIRRLAKAAIEYHLRDIMQKFNIDFVDVSLDDDYGVKLVARDGEKSLDMLSGGEKTAVAIAFRIALARVAGPRIGTVIMDEPTAHLDEERRRELVGIIRYGLSAAAGLGQLIVVTHNRELEEAADVIISVSREPGGYSRVERIDQSTY